MNENIALIFGVTGQDGAYLSKLLLKKGYKVFGTSRYPIVIHQNNLLRLGIQNGVSVSVVNTASPKEVLDIIKRSGATEIYNLAGQSSVGQSFIDPFGTIESIADGTINILEAIRLLGSSAKFYNACSSECFGNTAHPADESTPFLPCSPYGAGKAAAYWYVRNYRESFNLKSCSGILFNHESPLRPKNFVTSKIVNGAVDIYRGKTDFIELGNLSAVRDWGWAPEYVEAMWMMLQREKVEDFVIATGVSHSLMKFCDTVFSQLGLQAEKHIRTVDRFVRPNDILISCGNSSKAASVLGWQSTVPFNQLVENLVDAALSEASADSKIYDA